MKHPNCEMRKADLEKYFIHLAEALEHQSRCMHETLANEKVNRDWLLHRCRIIARYIDAMGGGAKRWMDRVEAEESIK